MNPHNLIPLHRQSIQQQADMLKSKLGITNASETPAREQSAIVQANANGTLKQVDATEAAPVQMRFFPFPSGGIVEWIQNVNQPGTFVLVINLEENPELEPRPHVVAISRVREIAQMLCDGLNFLFTVSNEAKAQQAAVEAAAVKLAAGDVSGAIVIEPPTKVDSSPLVE